MYVYLYIYMYRISVDRVVMRRFRLYEGRRERIKTTPDRRWEIRPIGKVIHIYTGFLYIYAVHICRVLYTYMQGYNVI